jgi:hypothetical protein
VALIKGVEKNNIVWEHEKKPLEMDLLLRKFAHVERKREV